VGDPAGHQLEDRNPLGRERLTARAPFFTNDQHPLGPRSGEERKDRPDLGRRREEDTPLRGDRRVVLIEGEHDGASFSKRPGTAAKPGQGPGHSYPAGRPMTGPSTNRESPF